MQELNSSQSMGNNGSGGGGIGSVGPNPNSSLGGSNGSQSDIRESPKIMLTGSMSQQQQQQQAQQQQSQQQQQSAKPKPSFRCDVCSYETSVARNLRIHMTSEKHTHNMAVLQNNIKHLQALSFLQSQNIGQLPNMPALPSLGGSIPNLAAAAAAGSMPNLGQALGANMQNFLPEAALADLAYNQALMIQLLHQNSGGMSGATVGGGAQPAAGTAGGTVSPMSAVAAAAAAQAASSNNTNATPTSGSIESDHGLNPDSFEPPIEPNCRPCHLFSCLVCAGFNTNSIEELNSHLLVDRSRTCNADIMKVVNNNYICLLCSYKTNLKANFQLHSKTDKHIQKLNYINHIKEGGERNHYKLNYNSNNSVQLKCNSCDYYTNSIQKLNLHTQNMRHENAKIIFQHLVYALQSGVTEQSNDAHDAEMEQMHGGAHHLSGALGTSGGGMVSTTHLNNSGSSTSSSTAGGSKVLLCQLCNYKAPHVLGMVQHVKSMRHVQIEQIICLQRRSENLDSLELADVFKIVTDNGKYNIHISLYSVFVFF